MTLGCPEPTREADILLRPHKREDVDGFARFLTDPTATRYMAFTDDQKSYDGARAMLDFVISGYGTDNEVLSLTIADSSDDTYLGSVGAAPTEDAGTVEIYFTVMPEQQGRGLATRAAAVLIDHLVAQPEVSSIRADVVKENPSSVRVLEKLGFRLAGEVDRAAQGGELGHATMSGLRYTLDAQQWRNGKATPKR